MTLPVVAEVEDLETPERANLLGQLLELVAAQVEHLDRVGRVGEGAATAQRRQLVALKMGRVCLSRYREYFDF